MSLQKKVIAGAITAVGICVAFTAWILISHAISERADARRTEATVRDVQMATAEMRAETERLARENQISRARLLDWPESKIGLVRDAQTRGGSAEAARRFPEIAKPR